MFGGMFSGGFPGMPGGGIPFPFFNGGGGPHQQMKAARGPNKIHEIGLSMADLYSGKTFKLNMKRDTLCGRCAGRGGTRVENCAHCSGRGFRMRGVQMGPIMSMSQEPCAPCGQTGQRILEECGECRGKRVVERESVLDVKVEPGMQEGDRITFVGQCSESPQFEKPGDVILIVRSATTDSDDWVRRGAELTYTVSLTMAEMLLGWERVIEGHPSGQPLNVAWTGGVLLEGSVLTLPGLGMPGSPGSSSGGKGDLKLVCRIQKESCGLSDEQRAALKLVWPEWKEVVISDQSKVPVLLA